MIILYKKDFEPNRFNIDYDSGQLTEIPTVGSPTASFNLDADEGELSYQSNITFFIEDGKYLSLEDENVRAVAYDLNYDGSFLEISKIEISIKSNYPINFNIGDFIIWSYDGRKYVLREAPSETKKARAGEYGEAFEYKLTLLSELYLMRSVDFLDVVLFDSNKHFTALPLFSFYGNVFDIADRLNQNLGRLYNDWQVLVDTTNPELVEKMSEVKNIEIDVVNCFDVLSIIWDKYKVGYHYYYDDVTSKNTIKIGVFAGDAPSLSYGQGNGLYSIIKTPIDEDKRYTRLRAYGSDKNRPNRYYNKVKNSFGEPLLDGLQYIPHLMTPKSKWGKTNGREDVLKAYIDANNPDVDAADTTMQEFGIIEKSLYFNGEDNTDEIFPTIEKITAGEIRQAISDYTGDEEYVAPTMIYPNYERMDLIKVGDNTNDDGVILAKETFSVNGLGVDFFDEKSTAQKRFDIALPIGYQATLERESDYSLLFKNHQILVQCYSKIPIGNGEYNIEPLMISDVTALIYLIENGNRTRLLDSVLSFTNTNGDVKISLSNRAAIKLTEVTEGQVVSLQIVLDIVFSDLERDQENFYKITSTAGSVDYISRKIIPNNRFTIKIKNIGFDISKFVADDGATAKISMTSGACAGREFEIAEDGVSYDGSDDSWVLTCNRQSDPSLGALFPNNSFKVSPGDSFILYDMSFPDIFVDIASIRLYNAACERLRFDKKRKYIYEPQVDEIYMAYYPSLIKEGMLMVIEDEDLGISEVQVIKNITATQKGDSLMTYKIVLKDDIDKDLQERINSTTKREGVRVINNIVNASTSKTRSVSNVPIFSVQAGAAQLGSGVLGSAAYRNTSDFHPIRGSLQLDLEAKTLNSMTLLVPNDEPDDLPTNRIALFADVAGFSGETPSGGTINVLNDIGDVSVSSAVSGQVLVRTFFGWGNSYIYKHMIQDFAHNHNDLYYTKSQIYTKAEINSLLSGYLPLIGGTLSGSLTATELITNKLRIPQYSSLSGLVAGNHYLFVL